MGCTNSKSTDVVESVGPRPTANPAGNTSTLTATVEINGTTKSNGAKVPHETNGVEIKQHEHPTQPNSNGKSETQNGQTALETDAQKNGKVIGVDDIHIGILDTSTPNADAAKVVAKANETAEPAHDSNVVEHPHTDAATEQVETTSPAVHTHEAKANEEAASNEVNGPAESESEPRDEHEGEIVEETRKDQQEVQAEPEVKQVENEVTQAHAEDDVQKETNEVTHEEHGHSADLSESQVQVDDEKQLQEEKPEVQVQESHSEQPVAESFVIVEENSRADDATSRTTVQDEHESLSGEVEVAGQEEQSAESTAKIDEHEKTPESELNETTSKDVDDDAEATAQDESLANKNENETNDGNASELQSS